MVHWLELNPPGTATLFGTFLQTTATAMADTLGALPFDFLCIEGEHSPIGADAMEPVIAAAGGHQMPCLVRVPSGDPARIKQALDAGAAGIVVPCIETPAEAEAAVRAARFPPAGARGCGPGRATGYGRNIAGYVEAADRNTVVIVQVETRAAFDNLDAILAVRGVDMILIGPGDLSIAYREAPGDPPVDSSGRVAEIAARCQQAGMRVATFALSAEAAAQARNQGMDAVIIGSDLMLARTAAAGALEAFGRG